MPSGPEIAQASVAVAVSGGRDSLYSLLRLREQGLAAFALHGRFLHAAKADPVPKLAEHCDSLGIPLHVADFRESFASQIVRPFVAEYLQAATPNPCAWCNARIKFGLLLDAALNLGAKRLATGHYVQLVDHPRYGRVLRRGEDDSKDQSYFLALVPRERLDRAVFPLGRLRKADITGQLAAMGVAVPLPSESQEICFVPQDAYRPFLASHTARLPGPGPIMLRDGTTVGRHQGLWSHTEGQRRGLGVAWSEPLYVIGKDMERNALIVGGRSELFVRGFRAGTVNAHVPPDLWPEKVSVQVRYRQKAFPAAVRLEGDSLRAMAIHPTSLAAPGQILTVYDADGHLLAGARITDNIW